MDMFLINCCIIIMFSVTIVNCYNIHIFGRYAHFPVPDYNYIFNQRLIHRMCFAYSKWIDCSFVQGERIPILLARHHPPDGNEEMVGISRIAPEESQIQTDEKSIRSVHFVQPSELEVNEMSPELNSMLNDHQDGVENESERVQEDPVQESPVVTSDATIMTTTEVNTPVANTFTNMQISTVPDNAKNSSNIENFMLALDRLERKFYLTTFSRLLSISPPDRQENGMSFVQSGLFLQLVLMTLSTEVDLQTKKEIDTSLGLTLSDLEKVEVIREVVSLLPIPSDDLRFRWSSRLVLTPPRNVSQQFVAGAASVLQLHVDTFTGAERPEQRAQILNDMVEHDSGGAIRNTFEEEEVAEGAEAVQVSMVYLRALWRAAPTVLNGTRPFRDAPAAPRRSARMIRINDLMGYAHLPEWDAEAIELSYSTSGLSLVVVVPRGPSLRQLSRLVADTSLQHICATMHTLRVAATMPLYTLRMTLLLPNKLEAMGILRLVNVTSSEEELRLSHAIQRIMFWAEAGRNAFKDDGIEWDEPPELELVIDRPYLFFVRWRNFTLMNGNFVL